MKKVFLSLFTILSILAGSETTAFAGNTQTKDSVRVRFRENTLVVTSPNMTEARLYTQNGKLVNKEKGKIAQFEIENRGKYTLYAKVDGKTVTRRVVMK
ncbi:MAG: hypothetical protein J6Y76_03965 [Paludibacteraceae bacterium]|jgi:hypothetical protein|nr:hypothetical protein [Paludibacteraceae bacterium]